jgi:hypothetical protein
MSGNKSGDVSALYAALSVRKSSSEEENRRHDGRRFVHANAEGSRGSKKDIESSSGIRP